MHLRITIYQNFFPNATIFFIFQRTMLEHIPEELRRLPQWVCCGADKVPRDPHTGRTIDYTNPAEWSTFEDAVKVGPHVGFCLSEHDPYCIIDLDDKIDDPSSDEQKATHHSIAQNLKTYLELSISGRGLHLICKAKLPMNRNCKAMRIEMYDRDRFFLLTGNCWNHPRPILEAQAAVDQIYASLPQVAHDGDWAKIDLNDADLIERDDDAILDEIRSGAQAALFDRLWGGDISAHNNNKSEADSALMSILTFRTKSNAQAARLFQRSGLGQRQKAYRPDYLQRTILVARRGRDVQEANITIRPPIRQPKVPKLERETSQLPSELPPGNFGLFVQELLETMPRPVYEIALVSAIGFLAGVCGRAWNVRRPKASGLNQYIVLLADTGTGKEQISGCIDFCVNQIGARCPNAEIFIGPGEFASAEGMMKTLNQQPCFVSVIGEIGKKMTAWDDGTHANPVATGIKRAMLDLYSKSGQGNSTKGMVYSNREKNVAQVEGPAMTLIGESAPQTYYEVLTESMIAEGFMPRWMVFHYTGPRVHAREQVREAFSEAMLERLVAIVSSALGQTSNGQVIDVPFDAEASQLATEFDQAVDDRINERISAVSDQLWNRAALKIYRLAALLAVMESPHFPMVTRVQFEFAKNLVTKEIEAMVAMFENGEMGSGDAKQSIELKRIVWEFYDSLPGKVNGTYGVPLRMHELGYIPYAYLQRRTACISAFRKDSRGSTTALHHAIQSLVNAGEIVECSPSAVAAAGFSGKAYKIPGR